MGGKVCQIAKLRSDTVLELESLSFGASSTRLESDDVRAEKPFPGDESGIRLDPDDRDDTGRILVVTLLLAVATARAIYYE